MKADAEARNELENKDMQSDHHCRDVVNCEAN